MSDTKKILLNNGVEVDIENPNKTRRGKERDFEDESFIPVIIKRNDESTRHPDDTLEHAIHDGLTQHKRKSSSLFLSSVAAGLILGFAGMCVALITQLFPASEGILSNRLATALVYPLGFIICIISGTQLFTEQTATAVYPVLDKKVRFKSLVRILVIVLLGNLLGTFASSILLFLADDVIGASQGFIEIKDHLIHYNFFQIFISAILAGWLMAQGGWLIVATPRGISQITSIFVVTFIIGLGGLHHSIVGSAEVFTGLLHSENADLASSFKFIASAILGNFIGGSFFVAILNYGHIKKTQ